MRFLATLAGIVVFAFLLARAVDVELGTPPAQAHLVRVPDRPSRSVLENRAASQRENLRHARYVCRRGGGAHKRWACWASSSVIRANGQGWLRRELRESMNLLRPATVPVISEMWHAISRCESGGRWHLNTGNGFYGGLQFLTSTWLAYGGGRYAPRADLARPWEQVRIASGMSLAHWPHCGAPYR